MLGLYQRVSSRWQHVPSCDWQCRPDGETADDAVDDEFGAVPAAPVAEPLSEEEARLGLYQVIAVIIIIIIIIISVARGLNILVFSRPYKRSRLWYNVSSVCLSSVVCNVCIVAKRYVVQGRRWYRWIGR